MVYKFKKNVGNFLNRLKCFVSLLSLIDLSHSIKLYEKVYIFQSFYQQDYNLILDCCLEFVVKLDYYGTQIGVASLQYERLKLIYVILYYIAFLVIYYSFEPVNYLYCSINQEEILSEQLLEVGPQYNREYSSS